MSHPYDESDSILVEDPLNPGVLVRLKDVLQRQSEVPDATAITLPAPTGGIDRLVSAELEDREINVKRFGAVGDGVTDDTAAIQAAHDWCWNGGAVRGSVFFPRGTYLVSDGDADDYALQWNDGVGLEGDGYGTKLTTASAIGILRVRGAAIVVGTWRKPPMRNFRIDGDDVATIGLEIYAGAYAHYENILVENCVANWVLDGPQNYTFVACMSKNGTKNWRWLNGMGSCQFYGSGSDGSAGRHIEIMNDAAFPAYNLRVSQGGALYDYCSFNVVMGGVWERQKTGGTCTHAVYIEALANNNVFIGAVFAGDSANTTRIVEDNGNWNRFTDCYIFTTVGSVDLVYFNGNNGNYVRTTAVGVTTGNVFHVQALKQIDIDGINGSVSGGYLVKYEGSGPTIPAYIRFRQKTPGWSTAGRPVTSTIHGIQEGFNYDIRAFEFYDPIQGAWRQRYHYHGETAANLANVAASINTVGKWLGKPVYDTTNNKYYYAIGTTAASAWRPFADDSGSGDITPA